VGLAVRIYQGMVMHYAGDAVLAKFDAVANAISAAVAIQNEIRTRNLCNSPYFSLCI
jgi:class 3 adenylate cyclase